MPEVFPSNHPSHSASNSTNILSSKARNCQRRCPPLVKAVVERIPLDPSTSIGSALVFQHHCNHSRAKRAGRLLAPRLLVHIHPIHCIGMYSCGWDGLHLLESKESKKLSIRCSLQASRSSYTLRTVLLDNAYSFHTLMASDG